MNINVKMEVAKALTAAGYTIQSEWVQLTKGRTWTASIRDIRGYESLAQYVGDSDKVEDGFSSVFIFDINKQIGVRPTGNYQ